MGRVPVDREPMVDEDMVRAAGWLAAYR